LFTTTGDDALLDRGLGRRHRVLHAGRALLGRLLTALDWESCPDNQTFTSNLADGLRHWTSGTGTAKEGTSRISTTSQREEPPPRSCSHVMASQANVVVETAVCGDNDTRVAANQIADRIMAKIPH
jgi:hypothetical protein